jgi:hypothetical protein
MDPKCREVNKLAVLTIFSAALGAYVAPYRWMSVFCILVGFLMVPVWAWHWFACPHRPPSERRGSSD